MKLLLTPSHLEGAVTPPSSKSLLHRELICRRLAGQATPLPPQAVMVNAITAASSREIYRFIRSTSCGFPCHFTILAAK